MERLGLGCRKERKDRISMHNGNCNDSSYSPANSAGHSALGVAGITMGTKVYEEGVSHKVSSFEKLG